MAGPYGPWRPAPQQPLSGLAVASLVLSLLICLAPLGLVLGIVALVRIPGNGKRGKGLAVAGTAVGGAVVAMSVLLLVIGGVRFDAWDGPSAVDAFAAERITPDRSSSGSSGRSDRTTGPVRNRPYGPLSGWCCRAAATWPGEASGRGLTLPLPSAPRAGARHAGHLTPRLGI
ncbi:DUF4190 domain-containing protein [Streptomyces sp. NPDC051657]|uniref:DUF4190 domain-containing protein n=1 Tax=unclassified Streptomyces TaxID=2593676 RepID=UPI00341EE858